MLNLSMFDLALSTIILDFDQLSDPPRGPLD